MATQPHHHSRSHSRLPPFDKLVENYPAAQTVTAVKQLIGGGADDTRAPPGPQQWLGGANGDTCTLRMSRAFNYSGSPIPHGSPGMRTVKGRDHFNYAFAVREFEAWARRNLGPPDIFKRANRVSLWLLDGKAMLSR